jgi:hypothetical protein
MRNSKFSEHQNITILRARGRHLINVGAPLVKDLLVARIPVIALRVAPVAIFAVVILRSVIAF